MAAEEPERDEDEQTPDGDESAESDTDGQSGGDEPGDSDDAGRRGDGGDERGDSGDAGRRGDGSDAPSPSGGGDGGHEQLARSAEKETDELAQRSREVGEQISDTRADWERKQASENVPGAVGEPDDGEDGA
jgi:transcription termination factor Rho